MNRQQATEAFTLFTTCRHVDIMNVDKSAYHWDKPTPGCLLCEGVRHGVYTVSEGMDLDDSTGFSKHFGCSWDEAHQILFHRDKRNYPDKLTTGENYYKAGKELLIKYGYGDLFETAQSFVPAKVTHAEIMEHLKMAVSVEF